MSIYNRIILLKGEPNDNIESCHYSEDKQKYIVTFDTGKSYNYNYDNIEWLENPEIIPIDLYEFTNSNGRKLFSIGEILMFKNSKSIFLRFIFKDGKYRTYDARDLTIKENILKNEKYENLIDYYTAIAGEIGLSGDDGTSYLKKQFEKMKFISNDSVLVKYLNASEVEKRELSKDEVIIFPFGSNLSQIKGVNNAVISDISIIEGAPGTGKTQTILNVLANAVIRGQTVAIVSNNNSATDNVFEKLEEYGFDYFGAQLGNAENKNNFINNQKGYPNLSKDLIEVNEMDSLKNDIFHLEDELVKMYKMQNMIAKLKSDLAAFKTEQKYFEEYFYLYYDDKYIFRTNANINSERILHLWNEYEGIMKNRKNIGFFFKLKTILLYGIKDFKLYNKNDNMIPLLKKHFYDIKISEINNEIDRLKKLLDGYEFKENVENLTNKSIKLFKSYLAERYTGRGERPCFDDDVFWKNPDKFLAEYPVILSTTHSLRSTLNDTLYDLVIVDETSQVDLVTGVLAMSCAKNMLIVGDLKQLPNVITTEDKNNIKNMSDFRKIPEEYRYEENSLLSSVCKVFKNAPRTLLKEHYRCHPKIIGFCNKKFYNNKLIIMTEDRGEKDVLKVHITVEGNHARGHYNKRQIDEIKYNILPELSSDDIGIISPYRAQTSALSKDLEGDIDISTVHKFQGREKEDIVISTVDNEISEFTDNPNMLNVAVSRAKNRLRLVISKNEKNEKTNIGDLVKYIRYNNFEIMESDISSVFDMLYKSYESIRIAHLSKYRRVSERDSENLMYSVIRDVLDEEIFPTLDIVANLPVNEIIRNFHKLSHEEKRYAMNDLTHVDFLIYNIIDNLPVLAVEVDGYSFHKEGTRQKERDDMKDKIFKKYDLPLMRFNTTESREKERLQRKLELLLGIIE